MPYKVIKSTKPKGWFVITSDTGKKHSNKPFKTKKEALAQLRALYVHANPDLESGAGIFDKVKDVYENVKGRLSGVRNDYAPSIRKLLKQIGDKQITQIDILRRPVPSILTTIINVISLGKFQETLNKKGFDNVFHLFMKVSYNGGAVIVEKNEVINIAPWDDKYLKDATSINVPLQEKQLTINQLLNGGRKIQGDNWFKYSAFNNNCQMFIKAILEGAGLYNDEINKFVFQDLTTLENEAKTASKVSDFITTTASKFHTLIHGKGLYYQNNLGI